MRSALSQFTRDFDGLQKKRPDDIEVLSKTVCRQFLRIYDLHIYVF